MAKRVGFDGNFICVKEEKNSNCFTFVDFEGDIIKVRTPKEFEVSPIKRLQPVSVDIDNVTSSFSNYDSESFKCDEFKITILKD